jgi:hypothetical protein
LFLKNGAGGVHDQLWQKSPVEEMGETATSKFSFVVPVSLAVRVLSIYAILRCGFVQSREPRALTIRASSARIIEVISHQTGSVPTSGPVAQLGARFHGMEEVVGSIPTRSTKSFHVTASPIT